MSVMYPEDADAVWVQDVPTPWTCFDCGDEVGPPLVQRRGAFFTILLHQACAEHLGPHLTADARECQLASSPAAHWRRRAVATVRHRLEQEERVA